MGVEGLDKAVSDAVDETETTEREDPVAKHERQNNEREEARKARSERLGHELFEEVEVEVKEEKPVAKKTVNKKSSESED
jgi:hypothetical protein